MTSTLHIARAAAFFGVLAIIALSLVPGIDRPHTGLPGEAEHFIAYCATAAAFALGFWSRASRIMIALGLTLLAGRWKLWVPGRHSAIGDAVVSGMGGPAKSRRPSVTEAGSPRHTGAPQSYTNGHLD